MNEADAYLTKDKIFIQGISMTVKKLPILYGDVFEVDMSETEEIGKFILEALKGSTRDVPHPDFITRKAKDEPILVAAGMNSWNKMMQASKNVGIDIKDDLVVFLPTKFKGTKMGYTHLNAKKFSCSPDPLSLGQALIKAFELCE